MEWRRVSPRKLTPVPRTAGLDSVSGELASDSEGKRPSATQRGAYRYASAMMTKCHSGTPTRTGRSTPCNSW
jgi:hypothetical protein